MAGAGMNGVSAPMERSLVDAFKQRIKPYPWAKLLEEIPNPPADYTPEEQVSRLVIGLLRTMERHHSEFAEDRIADCKIEEEFVDEDEPDLTPSVRLRKLRNIKIRCFQDLKEARENHRIMAQEVREVSQEFLTSKTRKRKTDDREVTEATPEDISKRKKLEPKPLATTNANAVNVPAQDLSHPDAPRTNGVEKPLFSSIPATSDKANAPIFSFAPTTSASTDTPGTTTPTVTSKSAGPAKTATNGDAKEAAENVFALSKIGPAASLQSPTLSFEPKSDPKPTQTFDAATAKPIFSFGNNDNAKESSTTETPFNFNSNNRDAAAAPKSPFTFGSAPAQSESTEKPVSADPQKSLFSFGASTKPSEPLTNISGNAGSPFSFGQKPDSALKETASPPVFSFDAPSADAAKDSSNPSPFLFGGSTATTAPASTATSKEPAKSSPFSFGAIQPASNDVGKEVPKAPSFVFGNSSASTTDSAKEPAKMSPFTFGTPAPSLGKETASKELPKASPFTFGNSAMGTHAPDKSDPPKASPFTFGNSTTAPAPAPAPAPAFNFGSNQTSTPFSFGAQPPSAEPSKPAVTSSFSFGAQNASANNSFSTNPASSFTFGQTAPNAAQNSPSFTFGTSQSTPTNGSFKAKRNFDSTENEQAPQAQAPPQGQRKILKPRGYKGGQSKGSSGGSFQFLAPPSAENSFASNLQNPGQNSFGAPPSDAMDHSPAKKSRPLANDDMMDSSPAKKPIDPDAMVDSPVKKKQSTGSFSFGQPAPSLGPNSTGSPFSFGNPPQTSAVPANPFAAKPAFQFGAPATTSAASPASTATTTAGPVLFGGNATSSTPSQGLFGGTTPSTSLFGASKTADTSNASLTATPSIFGSKPSLFGQNTNSPEPATKSLFGTAPTGSTFKFGEPTADSTKENHKPQPLGSLFGSSESKPPTTSLFLPKTNDEKPKEAHVTEVAKPASEKDTPAPAADETSTVVAKPAEEPPKAASAATTFNFGQPASAAPVVATPSGTSIFSSLQKPLPSFSFPAVPANSSKDDDKDEDKDDEKEEAAPSKPTSIFSGNTNSPFSFLAKPASNASSAASTPADSTPFSNISAPQTVATRFLNLPEFNSGMSSAASTPAAATDTGGETDVASDAEAVPGQQPEDVKQIDLMTSRAGEEDESLEFEIRAKALAREKNDSGTEEWKTQGLGQLRVLKDKSSGKGRILLRAEPSGKIIINSSIHGSDHKNNGTQLQILAPAPGAADKLAAWVIRVKTAADAEKLARALNEHKP